MPKSQNPWDVGPTELISFALEKMHGGTDFDRRLAFLILDVGVETLIKTFLTLPNSVSGARTSFSARKGATSGNFHQLLEGLKQAIPERIERFDLHHVNFYHDIRNTLYHQGNTVAAVRDEQLKGYANIAVEMLYELLEVDLRDHLTSPEPIKTSKGSYKNESVEVEISSGRYCIDRFSDNKIIVTNLEHNKKEIAKLILRDIISEKELNIELVNSAGNAKNTQQLGKDVIEALKISAWHGWVSGQRLHRNTIVAALTNRIRDGKASEKNWEVVDHMRNLKEDWLMFQPTGKGYGNSPFNLNCWSTEDGRSIR